MLALAGSTAILVQARAAPHHAPLNAQPSRSDVRSPSPDLSPIRHELSASPSTLLVELAQSPRIAVWSAWLTNGTRLHVKTLNQDAEPTFSIVITISGGEMLEPTGRRGLADIAASGWSLPKEGDGAGGDLVRRYLESRIRFRAVAHADSLQLIIAGPDEELPYAFELARLLLERPSINQTEVTRRVETLDAILSEVSGDPDMSMMDALRPFTLPVGMPAARPLARSDLGALTPALAEEWLRGSLMQGSIEVGIASRLSQPEVLNHAAHTLGLLPTRSRVSPLTGAPLRGSSPPEARTITITTAEPGNSGRAMIAMIGPERADIVSRRVLAMAMIVIDARFEALLEARYGPPPEGLVPPPNRRPSPTRSAWVRTYLSNPAARSSRAVYAIAATTPVAASGQVCDDLAALIDELARLGPLPGELDDAMSVVSMALSRQERSAETWAQKLSTLTYDGLGPETLATALENYHAVTPDDVRRALGEWWISERIIRIRVEPPQPD